MCPQSFYVPGLYQMHRSLPDHTRVNEGGMDMKHIIRVLYLLVFIASMALIITGQRNIGPAGLLTMLAGLAGILVLLNLYNKKYQ